MYTIENKWVVIKFVVASVEDGVTGLVVCSDSSWQRCDTCYMPWLLSDYNIFWKVLQCSCTSDVFSVSAWKFSMTSDRVWTCLSLHSSSGFILPFRSWTSKCILFSRLFVISCIDTFKSFISSLLLCISFVKASFVSAVLFSVCLVNILSDCIISLVILPALLNNFSNSG